MLSLDSDGWKDLRTAYGSASEIPDLVRRLREYPSEEDYRSDPWYSLWSALCHQGDVFTASYAAVPWIVEIAASAPERASHSFFLLPACIEVARRQKRGPGVPRVLNEAYLSALARIPALVAAAAEREWDDSLARAALAAVAVAKGHHGLAESIMELSKDVVPEFLSWVQDR